MIRKKTIKMTVNSDRLLDYLCVLGRVVTNIIYYFIINKL